MTRRSDSGSSRSPIAVEPVTSQKTTVTVLRVSCWAACGVRGAAHAGQKAKSSGLFRPQFPQVSTGRAYVMRSCRRDVPPQALARSQDPAALSAQDVTERNSVAVDRRDEREAVLRAVERQVPVGEHPSDID